MTLQEIRHKTSRYLILQIIHNYFNNTSFTYNNNPTKCIKLLQIPGLSSRAWPEQQSECTESPWDTPIYTSKCSC